MRLWLTLNKIRVPAEYESQVSSKKVEDLASRTSPGALAYFLIYAAVAIIILLVKPTQEKAILLAILVAINSIISVVRYVLLTVKIEDYKTNPERGLVMINLGIVANAFCWSLLFTAAITNTPLYQHHHFIQMATLCLSSGAILNTYIERSSILLFLIGMFLLPTVLIAVGASNLDPRLSLVLATYCGVMYVMSQLPRNEYERGIVSLLQLGDRASQLERLSNLDALTQIFNRRYFESQFSAEYGRARRLDYQLTLLYIDIDFFKRINDQHGHTVGDRCLQELAKILNGYFSRSGDTVSRIGGEEFAILLPGIDQTQGLKLAKGLCSSIATCGLAISKSKAMPITISIGGSTIHPLDDISQGEMREHADEALYQSKRQGRNQVNWWSHENQPPNQSPVPPTPNEVSES